MEIVLLIGFVCLLLFAGVVLFGAPYLPTLNRRVEDALDMLDLQSDQTMLELGSGDGRMLRAAAKRGIKSIGYEINPLLVMYSRLVGWRYRHLIEVKWGNYWTAEWPKSDGMYVFLLQPYMSKLHNKVVHYANKQPYKLVSFGFLMTEKKLSEQKRGMYLYRFN